MPEKVETDEGIAETLRICLDLEQFYPVLSAEKVDRIFPNSGLFFYSKDEMVVNQGEDSQDIYVVQTGSVHVMKTMGTAAADVAVIGPGDMFGEMALVDASRRTASVMAQEPSRIYRLVLDDVMRIMSMDDKLSKHLTELAKKRQA